MKHTFVTFGHIPYCSACGIVRVGVAADVQLPETIKFGPGTTTRPCPPNEVTRRLAECRPGLAHLHACPKCDKFLFNPTLGYCHECLYVVGDEKENSYANAKEKLKRDLRISRVVDPATGIAMNVVDLPPKKP